MVTLISGYTVVLADQIKRTGSIIGSGTTTIGTSPVFLGDEVTTTDSCYR